MKGRPRLRVEAADATEGTTTPLEAYRAAAASEASEKQLQEWVRQAAIARRWLFYHPWISKKSAAGFPDCTMVRMEDSRVIFAELKRMGEEPTVAQREWLQAFGEIPGVEVYVWRPIDWIDGTIEAVLQ